MTSLPGWLSPKQVLGWNAQEPQLWCNRVDIHLPWNLHSPFFFSLALEAQLQLTNMTKQKTFHLQILMTDAYEDDRTMSHNIPNKTHYISFMLPSQTLHPHTSSFYSFVASESHLKDKLKSRKSVTQKNQKEGGSMLKQRKKCNTKEATGAWLSLSKV